MPTAISSFCPVLAGSAIGVRAARYFGDTICEPISFRQGKMDNECSLRGPGEDDLCAAAPCLFGFEKVLQVEDAVADTFEICGEGEVQHVIGRSGWISKTSKFDCWRCPFASRCVGVEFALKRVIHGGDSSTDIREWLCVAAGRDFSRALGPDESTSLQDAFDGGGGVGALGRGGANPRGVTSTPLPSTVVPAPLGPGPDGLPQLTSVASTHVVAETPVSESRTAPWIVASAPSPTLRAVAGILDGRADDLLSLQVPPSPRPSPRRRSRSRSRSVVPDPTNGPSTSM